MKMKILSHILGCILFLSCHNSIDERGQKDVCNQPHQPQIDYNQIKDIVEDKQGYIWMVPQVEFTNTTESAIITTEAQKIQPAYVMTQS